MSEPQRRFITVTIALIAGCGFAPDKGGDLLRAETGQGTLLKWKTAAFPTAVTFRIFADNGSGAWKPLHQPIVNPTLVGGDAQTLSFKATDRDKRYWLEVTGNDEQFYVADDGSVSGGSPSATPEKTIISSQKATLTQPSLIGPTGGFSAAHVKSAHFGDVTLLAARITPDISGPSFCNSAPRATDVPRPPRAAFAAVDVAQTGWQRLSLASLKVASGTKQLDPTKLRLFADGVQQALHLHTNGTGAVDAIEFFGVARDSSWTRVRTYWLDARGNGKRVRRQNAAASVDEAVRSYAHLSEQREKILYLAAINNGEEDNYFGSGVFGSGATHTIDTTGITTNTKVRLWVKLQGITEAPHRTRVLWNGVEYAAVDYLNRESPELAFEIPASATTGNDQLLIVGSGGLDIAAVEYVRVAFDRALNLKLGKALRLLATGGETLSVAALASQDVRIVDFTNANRPKLLVPSFTATPTGLQATFKVRGSKLRRLEIVDNADIKQPKVRAYARTTWARRRNQADLLIVAPPAFEAAAQRLANHKQAEGLQAVVVPTKQIYDEFGGGGKDPAALRCFFNRAVTRWNKAPRYIILLGDASFDPLNHSGFGETDFVPTAMRFAHFIESAADDWMVDFDLDTHPDLALGRLPATSVTQADALVDKIISYEAQPADTDHDVLLVGGYDPVIDFDFIVTDLSSRVTPHWDKQTLVSGNSGAAIRSPMLDALNAGSSVVNYYGHGTPDNWTSNNFFSTNDARQLANDRKPVTVAVACLNGVFHNIFAESMAEALVNNPDGGSIGVLASSGRPYVGPAWADNRTVLDAIVGNPNQRIGDTILAAKQKMTGGLHLHWPYIGDPSLVLR